MEFIVFSLPNIIIFTDYEWIFERNIIMLGVRANRTPGNVDGGQTTHRKGRGRWVIHR